MRRFPGMRMEIRQTTKEKIMGIFSMILSLLSGVALFLFGMSLMGDCLLYTSDAADEEDSVDLGGRRIIKQKTKKKKKRTETNELNNIQL